METLRRNKESSAHASSHSFRAEEVFIPRTCQRSFRILEMATWERAIKHQNRLGRQNRIKAHSVAVSRAPRAPTHITICTTHTQNINDRPYIPANTHPRYLLSQASKYLHLPTNKRITSSPVHSLARPSKTADPAPTRVWTPLPRSIAARASPVSSLAPTLTSTSCHELHPSATIAPPMRNAGLLIN